MTIYPFVHQMETTVDVSLTSFSGHQFLDSTQTPTQSKWSERYVDKNGMNITFREVFQNFKETTKSADLIKIKSRPQSKEERITDTLNRTEKLLLSNDNARPQSRVKNQIKQITKLDENSSATVLHSHISDEKVSKIFSPCSGKKANYEQETRIEDGTNNAYENQTDHSIPALNLVITRKGKKPRKRTKSDHKARRIKPGRLTIPSTGIHNDPGKRLSATTEANKSTTTKSKPRIFSEPISSKPTQPNVLSCTLQMFSSEKTTTCNINKQISFTSNYKSASDLVHAHLENVETESSEKAVPSTHYTHGSLHANTNTGNQVYKQQLDASTIQIQPFAAQKIELSKRVKSGHSIKSEVLSLNASSIPEKPSSPVTAKNLFTLTAKSCHLPQMNHENLTTVIPEHSANQRDTQSPRDDTCISKESTLTAIYGPQNNIPHRAFNNADDFRKIKKIFLSERQSGTLKESGMEFPCAPPTTPMPDVMRRYEYVPCMNDIRSQRAVKNKLQVMEREALRRKEKKKEAIAKLEKQQSKDKEKSFKIRQRREIYALNKIMTELEHKRFLEFCHSKGLNT